MPKLLLADDSPTTQKVVQLTFADEGIDVVIADDGDTAMEMFDHHRPDIVLADINIPGLNGYEVCEAIRKRESNRNTPVVLLAGSFEPFDVEAAHHVGANDYLTKPFSSIRRLVATVTTLLDIAVKADEDTHDTVEPEGVETESEAASLQPEHHPAPGTKQVELEEPDMFSTSDIESLYSQSVSDPAEVTSQREESVPTNSHEHTSADPAPVSLDDSAFDDELIEATYIPAETEEAQKAHAENPSEDNEPQVIPLQLDETQADDEPSENLSAPQIPVPMDELPPEEVPQSQIPTVRFRTPMEESVTDREFRPSDEFRSRSFTGNTIETIRPISFERIDQTNDAAYFELAPDQPPADEQTDQPETEPIKTLSEDPSVEFQQSGSVDAQPSASELSGAEEQHGSEIFESGETVSAAQQELSEGSHADLPATTTPWDSFAQPQPQSFQLDEANLLEVPTDQGREAESKQAALPNAHASSAAFELAPEIVDQIAKLTATHISEEMIREIAKRIVPKVIEEVMTGRQEDTPPADHPDTTS